MDIKAAFLIKGFSETERDYHKNENQDPHSVCRIPVVESESEGSGLHCDPGFNFEVPYRSASAR